MKPLILSVCLSIGFAPASLLPVLRAQQPDHASAPAPACAPTGGSHTSCGLKVTPAASAMPRLAPFSLDSTSASASKLRYLTLDQMSGSDRALLQQAEPRIATRAASQGFHIAGQGSEADFADWQLRQAECSALPGYLLMSYTRDPGTNRTASFTVAIPRTASGHLHLVPVERRGYSLYTPSSRNAMTRVVFNDLLREDAHAARRNWFGLALCYAAIAGFRVQAATTLEPSGGDPHPAYIPASLSVSWKQPPSIAFDGLPPADSPAVKARPMQWTLFFTRQGTLGKVKTKAAHMLTAIPAKGTAVDLK